MVQTPPVIDPEGRDIPGEADRLRAEGPAVLVRLPAGIDAWYITRFDLLKELLRDPRVSKDPRRHWPAWQRGEYQETWVRSWIGFTNMLNTYGTDHHRLRKLVAPAFTLRRTEAMRPRVEAITAELLDDLEAASAGGTEAASAGGTDTASAGGAVVDLTASFAHRLPMLVICELFGIPEEARAETARLIDAIMDTTATPEQAARTMEDIQSAFGTLIAAKRAQPGDDLTSHLVSARDEEDGSRLTETELLDTLVLVIGAGHETTKNLIGNAVHALLTRPEQLRKVLDGDRSWDDVIEETLRWAPSIAAIPLRYAVEDIPLPDGGTIRQGDAILATFAAAGRDPLKHGPDAGDFDLDREDVEHLAFGHGVHYCLGAPLARMEARTALPALFTRFPRMRMAVEEKEITHVPSFIAHGYAPLPLRLEG